MHEKAHDIPLEKESRATQSQFVGISISGVFHADEYWTRSLRRYEGS